MSHMGLMPERAFEQVMPDVITFLKSKDLLTDRTELRYRKQGNTYILKIFDKHWLTEHRLTQWQLEPLPGCCGVIVSTAAVVYEQYRRKGLGQFFNTVRCEMARAMGYGMILCTVTGDNLAQLKLLEANSWESVKSFVNPKTTNRVFTYIKNL